MIKRYVTKIVVRFGIWRTIQVGLVSLFVVLLTTAVSQIFVPVNLQQPDSMAKNISEFTATETISTLLQENKNNKREAISYHPGMFKSASGLLDKPLADKTIERIKKQLKLKCVMEMNGQPVAYINILGVGLKKCSVGENVNDLFTVLDINKLNKSVDISIIEHKLTLHL